MAETQEIQMPVAENPPPLLSPNEHASTTGVAAKNPVVEKIGKISETIFGKFKVGRGRPRKDGAPKISDVPMDAAEVVEETVEQISSPAPKSVEEISALERPAANPAHASLLVKSVRACVKALLGFAKRKIRTKAKQAGIDSDFTEKTLAECAADESEALADFNEAFEAVREKYQLETKYAPEFAMGVAAFRIASPYWAMFQAFDAEIKRKRTEGK